MFNRETYLGEHVGRLVNVVDNGKKDHVVPNEHIRRIIQSAIQVESPFIKDSDRFVVLGNDGLDRSWYPTGSFKTKKGALSHVKQKQKEEHIYSDGDEASTTFHVFTREGVHISQVGR